MADEKYNWMEHNFAFVRKHPAVLGRVEHKERDRMFLVDKDLAYKLVGVLNEHWAPEAARYQSSSRATKGEKAITE